ncbi:helix-turn-helix transcriptional regulator [Paraburkholderia strydomiana]|uniref:helix-turn-helix transcriptional regulator n=1 Tax=Paraburkholderia strydomiana TaxID=1245417 RepID=UPI0038BADB9C
MSNVSTTKELPKSGLVRRSQFKGVIPLGDTSIWKMVREGRFPQPLRVSANLRLWRAEELHDWMRVGPDEWKAAHSLASSDEAA